MDQTSIIDWQPRDMAEWNVADVDVTAISDGAITIKQRAPGPWHEVLRLPLNYSRDSGAQVTVIMTLDCACFAE